MRGQSGANEGDRLVQPVPPDGEAENAEGQVLAQPAPPGSPSEGDATVIVLDLLRPDGEEYVPL